MAAKLWTNPARGAYFVCRPCLAVFFVPLDALRDRRQGRDPTGYDVTCHRCGTGAVLYQRFGRRYRPSLVVV